MSADAVGAMLEIWRELFEGEEISEDTDYIAIGGTSLLAVRLRARIRERFGRDVDLVDIFDRGTPRELAAYTLEAPLWTDEPEDEEALAG
jgi:hypothetical protein